MTILYDPNDFNELSVLTIWRGTIMPFVLGRPAIWLLLIAHIAFLYMHMYREDIEMPKLPWKLIGVPTSLLTFFLVFYSSNCFKRYYDMFGRCMNMAGCVQAYVGLLRVHFPDSYSCGTPPQRQRAQAAARGRAVKHIQLHIILYALCRDPVCGSVYTVSRAPVHGVLPTTRR